jgi:hypothetical protein
LNIYLAWIASKVKAVAPVLPSGGTTTVIPSMNNAIAKGSGGSMGVPIVEKITTRRRAHSRKKPTTTTLATVVIKTTASSNEDEQDSPDNEKAAKAAIKRVVRALFNRQ